MPFDPLMPSAETFPERLGSFFAWAPARQARGEAPVLSLFGLRVRRARLAAGLKASEVFARSGIHPTHLSRIENGRRYPEAETLCALA